VKLGNTPPTTVGTNIFYNTGSGRTITIKWPSGANAAYTTDPSDAGKAWNGSNWWAWASTQWGSTNVATIASGTY
jgi:hypothetical protein